MTTMTSVAAPAGEWTLAYTSAADNTDIGIANNSPGVLLRVRIDASATVGDAETAGHVVVQALELRSFGSLANGDKVLVRPVGASDGLLTVWA